jgi:hypothetical protein
MPLLEINASKKVNVTCSLEESTAKLVDEYAAFCKVPADDVVNKALEYVFSKDKEFQQYRISNPAVQVASGLRIKKPVPSAAATKNGSQPVLVEAK